ncbi:MAG: glycine zipper 2TM domain-containing protein [Novosphingobium sp.]
MRTLLAASLAAATLLSGCATDNYRDGYRDQYARWGYYDRNYYTRYGNYDYNNPDPSYGGYYPERYYRSDRRYHNYRMSSDDRVYRGQDGRFYCRRSDGSTGLIVGGIAGGVLGNIIAPGDSKTLGTILGAAGGAAIGAAADSGSVDCR